MATAQFRIYLTGQVCLEAGHTLITEHQFPGRQGRLVFAYLVCERRHPVPRDALGEVVWPGVQPAAWEVALSALISTLRRLFHSLGMPPGAVSIRSHAGRYAMHLPLETWVDLEAATQALDEAEGRLRTGGMRQAYWPTNVAVAIAQRPFLPGDDGLWVDFQRSRLREVLLRALDCLADISLQHHEEPLAVHYARETVRLEPFRETGYQRLMRVHAALGNRAEALRVYERCRELLLEEVGINPSPETQALYLSLLRSPSPTG